MATLLDDNTNPGVVFIEKSSKQMQADLSVFSMRAVQDVLEISEALEMLERHAISHMGFKNRRGLIGALAASGFALSGMPDSTFELIAYREKKRWGSPRWIEEDTVWAAAQVPGTWDTVDNENKRVVFAPHSPDPILFGIRGKSESALQRAFCTIRSEPVERHVVYETNQNTDMHLVRARICDVQEDRSYILEGRVSRSPRTIKGGHVIFELKDCTAAIECAAFEPTKGFRNIIRHLLPGDDLVACGSVKNKTLNLEKIKIKALRGHIFQNPVCCGKRMKSMGSGQGYRCMKCGLKKRDRADVVLTRNISPGFYEVPPCARRHLSMPLMRFR